MRRDLGADPPAADPHHRRRPASGGERRRHLLRRGRAFRFLLIAPPSGLHAKFATAGCTNRRQFRLVDGDVITVPFTVQAR